MADAKYATDWVDVRLLRLDVDAERLHELESCLSKEEQDTASRFRAPSDRERYIASHGQLRESLASRLGTSPWALEFAKGFCGKPRLRGAEGELTFSMSRSFGVALVCMAWGRRVGVDIERIRPCPEMDPVVHQAFSWNEAAGILGAPAAARLRIFYNCWTRKEAYVKGLGDGLSAELNSFEVSVLPGEPARLVFMDGETLPAEQWTLVDLPVEQSFAAALAVEGGPFRMLFSGSAGAGN